MAVDFHFGFLSAADLTDLARIRRGGFQRPPIPGHLADGNAVVIVADLASAHIGQCVAQRRNELCGDQDFNFDTGKIHSALILLSLVLRSARTDGRALPIAAVEQTALVRVVALVIAVKNLTAFGHPAVIPLV